MVDERFLPGAVAMIHSFLRTSLWFEGDIVVICDERLTESGRRVLASMFENVRFREVRAELRERIDELARHKPEFAGCKARFYYLEALGLRGYRKVLVCDADILFQDDIREMFDRDDPLVAAPDGPGHAGRGRDRRTFKPMDPTPDCLRETFNCGLLLFSGELLTDENERNLIESVTPEKWREVETTSTDQFLYNLYFEGRVAIVGGEFNYLLRHREKIQRASGVKLSEAKVIHFNVAPRPWDLREVLEADFDPEIMRACELWNEEYRRCLRRLQQNDSPSQWRDACVGAKHDLEQLIRTHLFIISPNNSGSTFLKNVLATSPRTWNLNREGQNTFGFAGPNPTRLKIPYLWASESRWLEALRDESAYDWEKTRRAWYFQAYSTNPNADVFVEKSPPFVLHVGSLSRHFRNAKFLFLVRDPYAVAEGILRRVAPLHSTREIAIEKTATHILNCLRWQAENLAEFGDRGILIRYEDLCANPTETGRRVAQLVPELEGLDLNQRVEVKGMYDEPLRNMNAVQIGRLSEADLNALSAAFAAERELLERFGYELLCEPDLSSRC